MAPRVRAGDYVWVDPDEPAADGRLVAVRDPARGGETVVRLLVERDGRRTLCTLDGLCPERTVDAGNETDIPALAGEPSNNTIPAYRSNILAPEAEFHCLVAHEVAHLAVRPLGEVLADCTEPLPQDGAGETAARSASRKSTVDLGRVVNLPEPLDPERREDRTEARCARRGGAGAAARSRRASVRAVSVSGRQRKWKHKSAPGGLSLPPAWVVNSIQCTIADRNRRDRNAIEPQAT